MTLNEYKNLKPGDIVVHVRKTYQNYDHTKIPCEPKIYKFKANNSSGIYLEYLYKRPFMIDGVKYASSMGWDNRLFCESCETLENYISGNYNKDIILDKQRWNSLEEFLLFKMENDYQNARNQK